MPKRKLTTASYLVLGMVEMLEPVTPYTLKRVAQDTVVHFWSLPHSQLYAQCDRLLESGYLSEEREKDGRKRRVLSLTKSGREAIEAWRDKPSLVGADIRDEATLKLFFGSDPAMIAEEQIEIHEAILKHYKQLAKFEGMAPGARKALEMGIDFERNILRSWKELRD